jgi:hypothetical protein
MSVEIQAKLTAIGPVQKMKTIKNKETGEVRFETETTYQLKAALKKTKLGKDENLVEGTGDPWGTVKIETEDKGLLEEFKGMKLGSDIIISVDKM